MQIPNVLTDFLLHKDEYVAYIREHKNCCSTYYQGDDRFVIRDGFVFYWQMGPEENYFQWKLKID